MASGKSFVASFDVSERVLADGRIITPGEPFELSAADQKDPHNARLIEEGKFSEVQTEGGEK